jgi:hypothetical protein
MAIETGHFQVPQGKTTIEDEEGEGEGRWKEVERGGKREFGKARRVEER